MPKVALLTSFHGTETAIGHAIRNWVLLFGLGNVSIFCKTNKLKTNILYYTENTPVVMGSMTLLFYSLCEMGYFLRWESNPRIPACKASTYPPGQALRDYTVCVLGDFIAESLNVYFIKLLSNWSVRQVWSSGADPDQSAHKGAVWSGSARLSISFAITIIVISVYVINLTSALHGWYQFRYHIYWDRLAKTNEKGLIMVFNFGIC